VSDRFFINMPIPADKYEAVCAVLAGVSTLALATASASVPETAKPTVAAAVSQDTGQSSDNTGGSQESGASVGTGATATTDASPSDGEVDAHGHPWSADLHASTKGKTKDGLWRMKVGVTRPDPKPGFPVDNGAATGTSSETPTPSATSQTATEPASAPAATSTDEDDEFAAFRNAAAASETVDTAAAAAVPARQFSDADLGALCNQAAVKLGDPGPVKEIIARFIPAGEVAHSRNIPTDKREEFAKAVEEKAGITFAG
jgi:hypothetical protein